MRHKSDEVDDKEIAIRTSNLNAPKSTINQIPLLIELVVSHLFNVSSSFIHLFYELIWIYLDKYFIDVYILIVSIS